MTRRRTVVLVAVPAVLAVAAWAAADPAGLRVGLAVVGCLLLPGLGWARKMHLGDRGDTLALAVVLSMSTTVAVGTTMAVADAWSTGWGLAVLGLVATAGFVPAGALADRARAAARRRTAAFGDDDGAWGQWQAQARRRGRRSEAAATADVWVDWYADIERRTADEQTRKALAADQAHEEWVDWYQRTQLPAVADDKQGERR